MAATRTKKISLAAAATLAAVLGVVGAGRFVAFGQSNVAHTWTYSWNAPTVRPDLVNWYLVEFVVNNRDTLTIDRVAETRVVIPVDLGKDYKVRVRAHVDATRYGPWSNWSVMETFEEDPPSNE